MMAALARHLLESTLFCVLLGAVACCLRRQGAAARHTVWLIGVSKFLVPTFLLAATGARIAAIFPATAWVLEMALKVSDVLAVLFGNWPSRLAAGEVTAASLGLLLLWASGSVLMIWGWAKRLGCSYDGIPDDSAEPSAALARAKRRIGLRGAIELRSSTRVSEPCLVGMVRPAITLPKGLAARLSSDELEAVLLHELAHARRRDNLAGAFVHAIVCLFWFHPLLRLVEKRLHAERESACDEAVIQCGTAPRVYLAGLAKVCQFHVAAEAAGVSAMGGSNLKARFERILSPRLVKPTPFAVRALLACAAVLITLLPIANGYCEQCVSSVSSGQGQPHMVQDGPRGQ